MVYAVDAPVAQLDRVTGYELGGRGSESLRAHHFFAPVAQWIERELPKLCVGGSIPFGGAILQPEFLG